jgi:hypothetical protein
MRRAVSRCTLQIGDSVVLVAQGGPPEIEYALFDPGEIELLATEPGRIREIGYRTVASHTRARLADLGITPKLAHEAAVELKAPAARSYARGAAVRRIVDRLGPAELFEGGTFDAATGRYAGAWLALDVLAADLSVPQASLILQALHLVAALEQCDDDLPVVLATAQVSAERRPGERTFKRVTLDDPAAIVAALASLKPGSEREGTDAGPSKQEILDCLRQRTQLLPGSRERMSAIEAALGSREPPARGPLADGELWALETKLSAGDASDVAERIDAFERRRGRLPGTMYLRARLALMNRAEDPRTIAERVSALSTSMATFHELQLLAAQAWIAAGDMRRARAFARDLLDNKTASDDMRMGALDVLEIAGQSSTSLAQLPTSPKTLPSADGPPSSGVAENPASRVHDATNPELDPPSSRPMSTPAPPRSPTAPPRSPSDPSPRAADSRGGSTPRRSFHPSTTMPAYRVEARGDSQWSVPPPPDMEGEPVETLSLPAGLSAEAPPSDEVPRNPPAARLSFTYLARELGRELRLRHGLQLRTDVEGLEIAQRYLREAVPDGRVRTPDEDREVMRTGAFLAELLARRLSARWADLESQEPAGWSMLIACRSARPASTGGSTQTGGPSTPRQAMRVWPFGRVMRFVTMGHKERDLVSTFLELDWRAR